ncbi:MAG: hypothetical protein H3C62_00260 [Gemmatimonadaceae bacterium]|nr:hypothetical protein [Gemmatimonadaceae bacterium]
MMLRLSFLRGLLNGESTPRLRRLLREWRQRGIAVHQTRLADLFTLAHERVLATGGNPYTIATAYVALLEAELPDELLYVRPEAWCRDVFADYGMVMRSRIRLVEIKGARDTFARLRQQLAGYLVAGSDVDVVVDRVHAERALRDVPSSVGLVVVDRDVAQRVRPAPSAEAFWSLWGLYTHIAWHSASCTHVEAEVHRLSVERGLVPRDAPPTTDMPLRLMHDVLVPHMGTRASERPLAALRTEFPGALHPLLLGLRASRREAEKVLRRLRCPATAVA